MSYLKVFGSSLFLLMCLGLAACDSDGASVASENTSVSGEENAGDASDVTEEPDNSDTDNSPGPTEEPENSDTANTPDSTEEPENSDTVNTPDSTEEPENSDTVNTPDPTEEPDNSDTSTPSNPSEGAENTDTGSTDGLPSADSNQPNILLVIADDQGLDASAQYSFSSDLPNTPVINALAANGITYDNAWATPSCTTTRAALLTGKHGVNNGVPQTPGTLSPSVGTIQQYLQDTGSNYSTGVFGKWHVAGSDPELNHPASLGVQHYAGNLIGNLDNYSDWLVTVNGEQSQSTTYHTTALVDNALGWINEQDQPWFAWLAFAAPHSPFHVPPAGFNSRDLSGTQADIDANTRDYYLAAIETMDTELGRLLDSMSAEDRENTLIMVIGDNGTPAGVIDRSVFSRTHNKGSLFEGGVAVPLVISGAGVTRTNEREAGLVNIVDVFPTIASLSGQNVTALHDGHSLVPSFSTPGSINREYSYTEFSSDNPLGTGWTVRSERYKYIAFADGTQNFFDLDLDPDENNNLFPLDADLQTVASTLEAFGLDVRNEAPTSNDALDITNSTLLNNSPNCADHVRNYVANANDSSTGIAYEANLSIAVNDTHCLLNTNATPNHDFNDGSRGFPNAFSQQDIDYRIALQPSIAATATPLSLSYDDAILLNGVKVDLLAAGCFGVGDGRIGCNDDAQPWRFDPMFEQNGFRVDSHNAHTQPDGAYHYHGDPLALFDRSGANVSPVVGFAADGFPIYGSFINDNGTIREVMSSFQLKSGARPNGEGDPGGNFDGSYRDDYEYVAGSGDLDECNGAVINGEYRYFITQEYPYVMACFSGTVDESFRK